ncbi:MAG: 16S rRNA (cytidine(1402)-2'-O)-methyltransferase [Opitutales bacterium]
MLPDSKSSGCLYLVASPIGNLGDISSRAIETLVNCDFIACEDTRVTGKLLSRLEIQKKLISYREENEKAKSLQIAQEIEQGKKVALLSDAGYPCISDPGFRLVRECHIQQLKVIPIPGPNAALTALAVSGLPTHQYTYLGFLPKKSAQTRKILDSWIAYEGSIVLYESKYKIQKTLLLISEIMGEDRFVCLARELTKSHESILTGRIAEVIEQQSKSSGKGEFTLVIAPQDYSF